MAFEKLRKFLIGDVSTAKLVLEISKNSPSSYIMVEMYIDNNKNGGAQDYHPDRILEELAAEDVYFEDRIKIAKSILKHERIDSQVIDNDEKGITAKAYERAIENGKSRLAELLPPTQKGFIRAVEMGNLTEVKHYIKARENLIDKPENDLEHAYDIAVRNERWKIAKLLPPHISEENSKAAFDGGNIMEFRRQIEGGSDPNSKYHKGYYDPYRPFLRLYAPFLITAVVDGKKEFVKFLVKDKKTNLNAVATSVEGKDLTAYGWSIARKVYDITPLLPYPITKINEAARKNDMADILHNYHLVPEKTLLLLVKGGHKEVLLRLMVDHGLDLRKLNPKLSDYDTEGKELVLTAAASGNLAMLKFLVDGKPKLSLDVKDIYGNNPLAVATMEGHIELVRYLVEIKECGISELNSFKQSPFDLADEGNHTEIHSLLCRQAVQEHGNNGQKPGDIECKVYSDDNKLDDYPPPAYSEYSENAGLFRPQKARDSEPEERQMFANGQVLNFRSSPSN